MASVLFLTVLLFLLDQASASQKYNELLSAALESPTRISNKEGWLALFGGKGVIEDPVGSPAMGPAAERREQFYDTFAAGRNITMEPLEREYPTAWVDLRKRVVVRAVKIRAEQNGAGFVVPAHVKYVFDERMKIVRLRAHWQHFSLRPSWQTWTDIVPVLSLGFQTYWRMARICGVRYFFSYSLNMLITAIKFFAKRTVNDFVKHVNNGHMDKLAKMFSRGTAVSLPVQGQSHLPRKLLSDSELQSIKVSRTFTGGGWISFEFVVQLKSNEGRPGLGFFKLSNGGKILTAELFWETFPTVAAVNVDFDETQALKEPEL